MQGYFVEKSTGIPHCINTQLYEPVDECRGEELLVTWNRRKTALNCKNSPSKVHNKHHIGIKGIPYVHKKVLHTSEVMKSLHTCESVTYL